jgi:hypothetical protein
MLPFRIARMLALLLACIAVPATAGRWSCADAMIFRLCTQGSSHEAGALAAQLESFDALLRQLTGSGPPGKTARVTLYIVDDPAVFDAMSRLGPGYDGFYTATPTAISAFVRRSPRLQATMFHEYAHHFMFANLPGSYPAWYIEGLAGYWETARFERGKAVYGDFDRSRTNTLVFRSWMPMTRVLGSDWTTIPGYETPLFYAQSWLAVHYLSRDPVRGEGLRRYLAAVAAGTPAEDAFRDCFGMPLQQFDHVLITYVMSRALTMTELPWNYAPPPANVTTLDQIASDLLLPLAQLGIGPDARACAGLLAKIHAVATKAPQDPAVRDAMIEVELRCGNSGRAQALLIAAGPASGDAQLLLLQGLADIADHRSAIATLAAADAARPDDYSILYLRALAAPQPFDAATLALLLRAHALAPQVDSLAMATAQAALDNGKPALARSLLLPVAHNPHGGDAAARAAAMLASPRM